MKLKSMSHNVSFILDIILFLIKMNRHNIWNIYILILWLCLRGILNIQMHLLQVAFLILLIISSHGEQALLIKWSLGILWRLNLILLLSMILSLLAFLKQLKTMLIIAIDPARSEHMYGSYCLCFI